MGQFSATILGSVQFARGNYQPSFIHQTLLPIEVTAVRVLENNMSQSNRLGLLGRKVGMMRLFTDDGDAVPVTVVDVSNNRVTQVKTQENDGYVALQVTFGARKASRVTKPQAGHLAKAGVEQAKSPKNSTLPLKPLRNTRLVLLCL